LYPRSWITYHKQKQEEINAIKKTKKIIIEIFIDQNWWKQEKEWDKFNDKKRKKTKKIFYS